MTADWALPAWLVVLVLAGVLVVAASGALVLVRLRNRIDHELHRARRDMASLRHQVEEIDRRQGGPAPVVGEDGEFVITSLTGQLPENRETDTEPATVDARLFGDLVLREAVVQAASWAHGVRRALTPEARNRIRFEMRREVKRSRKQRRADLREARREWEARQRSGIRLEADDPEDSAA